VSQTFCRQTCFTSPCLAKNKQVMATQSKLVCLKLVLFYSAGTQKYKNETMRQSETF
jgi:hypothetical protein